MSDYFLLNLRWPLQHADVESKTAHSGALADIETWDAFSECIFERYGDASFTVSLRNRRTIFLDVFVFL